MRVRVELVLMTMAVGDHRVLLTQDGQIPSRELEDGKRAVEVAKDILQDFVKIDRDWLELRFCGFFDDPDDIFENDRVITVGFGSFVPATTTNTDGKWEPIRGLSTERNAETIRDAAIALSYFGHGA